MSLCYLIAEPETGRVRRRSHEPAMPSEPEVLSLRVSKAVWKSYRAGDMVEAADLAPAVYDRWIGARTRARSEEW